MREYRTEAIVTNNRTLILEDLPFQEGEKVEIVVRTSKRGVESGERYPLRGAPIQYTDPFESVAEDDWEALRPQFGSARGLITISEDFDEPLEDFEKYS